MTVEYHTRIPLCISKKVPKGPRWQWYEHRGVVYWEASVSRIREGFRALRFTRKRGQRKL